ncbi:MAG TPA: UDP-3-O-(3-hydroxymyristoyl)glucosamine N-acyltransferase [Woeseiaceae bacterium]|nr:UDP-3-O-(3-hydroxymyristoyl)glucosamine N-acyltransferase [Woeseiaceae bacterium]
MPIKLGELAAQFDCELVGDPDITIDNVAGLQNAGPGSLSFLSNPKFRSQLAVTQAAAVVLRTEDVEGSPAASLVSANPYADYARMAAVIHPAPRYAPGVHASAVIAESAAISPTAHVAANVSIGDRTTIGGNAYIGPGTVIGPDCSVGDDCRLIANVTLVRKVKMGLRGILHPGVVIGADGFGNAMTPAGWVKVPQLGGVRIGDDVEIGSNTTVDCGAIEDTVIEDGVRIDNLCHIAHNARIGAHTAMAAMSGLSGSATIGKRCLLAGQTGVVGHVTVCDDVVVSGRAVISKDITQPGVYAGTFTAEPAREWNRQVARFRRLEQLIERVSKLEKTGK